MKHLHYFIIAILLLALHSCKDSWSDSQIINEVGEDCALNDIFIDEFGNEGIIAYIYSKEDDEGLLKYIIAISADEGYESWGPMGEAVYKVDSINFDSLSDHLLFFRPAFGLMMQQSMKSMGINRFPAQHWCDLKNQGDSYPSASSWRLPTVYEWLRIIENAGLNDALVSIGGTPLDNSHYYWTCTEDIEGYISFDDSTTYDRENRAVIANTIAQTTYDKDYWLKKNKHHVRAIKYVYYNRIVYSED